MTAPSPESTASGSMSAESAPLLEPPPPPVLAPPTTAAPPPPPPMPTSMPSIPPIGDLLVMLGGLMIVGFSFAPFVSYTVSTSRLFQMSTLNRTAWEWGAFLAPLTWFVVLGGLLLLALGLSHLLSGDRQLFTIKVSQLQLIVAAYAASILVGYAMADKSLRMNVSLLDTQVQVGSGEFAWGGVLMLVGSLLAILGAILTVTRPAAFGAFRAPNRGFAAQPPSRQ